MPSGDDTLDRLRAAIDELVAADAEGLVAQARADARSRVRSTLAELMERSMLEHVSEQLAPPSPPAEVEPRVPVEPRIPVEAEPRGESESGDAWYVYGVLDAGTEAEALAGVDASGPVEMLREGPVAAAASQVALEDFGEERLREHLRDMQWVERVARAHEHVLDQLRARATVIPMRMCTVYRTESGVREMLRLQVVALGAAIDHLDGKAEWGVKAFADARNLAAVGGSEVEDAPNEEVRGAAYMQRKRDEQDRREHARQRLEGSAVRIHERLCELAADGLMVPPQRPEVSGHDGDMVLNGVYLVADDATERFHEEVQALQAEYAPLGIELEATGPWPAYNFVPGTIGAGW